MKKPRKKHEGGQVGITYLSILMIFAGYSRQRNLISLLSYLNPTTNAIPTNIIYRVSTTKSRTHSDIMP